jgi:hypothetical protein
MPLFASSAVPLMLAAAKFAVESEGSVDCALIHELAAAATRNMSHAANCMWKLKRIVTLSPPFQDFVQIRGRILKTCIR